MSNVKSEKIISTTGQVRSLLVNALKRSSEGNLSAADGKNMIGLANQITTSLAVEIKHQNLQKSLGVEVTTFGKLNIGG